MNPDQSSEWQEVINDLERRREVSRAMGGAERLAKHAVGGRLDARARIAHVLDADSFREFGTLVGGADAPADAIVTGAGLIDGRPVMVAAEDFTVKAGTISQSANAKRYRIAEMALTDRVPLIMILEGAGFRADGRHGRRAPTDLIAQARCSGQVPLVTAVLGPSAGHGALVAPLSDFTVMSDHGSIFTAGPPVVLESLGEQISKEDLGGPSVALASGLIHNATPGDAAALDLVRAYLSYFPSSAWSYPDSLDEGDVGHRPVPELLNIVPRSGRQAYDMHEVIDAVFDTDSCLEVQPTYGPSVIVSLCRLGGHPVAVVANQPKTRAGSIDADGADKATHFITVADSFHLPLIFLADNPGVMPGSASEKQAILKKGARMYAAQTQATVPKLQVTLRKAYGFGSMVMAMIPFDGQSGIFAFPGATMGAMGAAAMGRARGSDAEEAEQLRLAEVEASYRSARGLGFDELINPTETRDVLLDALERALYRRQAAPEPVARVTIMP